MLICDNNLRNFLQASPSDPENFPFVVLGNKVDEDGGNSRVVCALSVSNKTPSVSIFLSVDKQMLLVICRFQRKRHGHGVLRKGISLTLRPLPRKVLMLRKLSNA